MREGGWNAAESRNLWGRKGTLENVICWPCARERELKSQQEDPLAVSARVAMITTIDLEGESVGGKIFSFQIYE